MFDVGTVTPGENADNMIGQYTTGSLDYTESSPNDGANSAGLNAPEGVAIDTNNDEHTSTPVMKSPTNPNEISPTNPNEISPTNIQNIHTQTHETMIRYDAVRDSYTIDVNAIDVNAIDVNAIDTTDDVVIVEKNDNTLIKQDYIFI